MTAGRCVNTSVQQSKLVKNTVANYIQNKVMFCFIEQEAACVKLSRRPSELRSWLIRPSLLSTKLLNRMY